MKNHFKCLLSLFLVVIMLVPMISATGLTVTAATYSGTCGDNLTWSYDADTATLTIDGTGDMYYYGKYYNGSYSTTAPWNSYIQDIKSVIISDCVTSIGGYAFYHCDSLTSVTIPDSVTSIGWYAFESCNLLSNINIPDSVTTIGNCAFSYCDSIVSMTIPDSVTDIGHSAFFSCNSLTNLIIGDSVISIGDCAFKHCKSLTNVVIGNSVKNIGTSAFEKCIALTDVIIPDSVTVLGNDAFYYCESLTSVTIPESVTTIGSSVFYCCKSLTGVTISNSVTSIGSQAFIYCQSLTSVAIPDSVRSIGNSAFAYCTSLADVTIPDSVTSIGYSAFRGCSSLASINIPDFVTSIDGEVFRGCTSLTGITIPDSVRSIGSMAFRGCSSLASINIPYSVTSIGSSPFTDCTSLTSVSVDEDNKYYLSDECGVLFDKDKNVLIQYPVASTNIAYNIPASVTEIADSAFNKCTSLESVSVDENNNYYSSDEHGVLFDKDKNVLIQYPGGNTSKNYSIPDTVTSIVSFAFDECTFLENVIIPESVTSIGYRAFEGCSSLVSVVIPDSVTSIAQNAFENCTSLISVVIGDSVTSIGAYIFTACTSLASVVIGDSVTDIGYYSFSNCTSLTSVVIGDSVNRIGESAFEGCTSLVSITIPDSVTRISYDAFRYYCDGYPCNLNVTFRCYENSYAHKYAVNYGFEYELICDHIFTDYISDNNASCTVDGTKTACCNKGCGETDTVTDVGSALGHTWSEWVVTVEPTYTTEGEQIRFCYVCDTVENEIIPAVTNPEAPVITVDNFTVTITDAENIKDMRYAPGEYTTTTEIRNAEGNVALDNGVVTANTVDGNFVYTMPNGGMYSIWIRMKDGTNYILPLDVTKVTASVSTYGVKITVHDIFDIKDIYIAKGEYQTYREIKDNGYIVSLSPSKIGNKRDYTYTVYEPGVHTVLVRYNDGRTALFHETLTVEEPEITVNGLQVTVSNIPDVKVIRTAYGVYNTPGDVKRAEGARNFSGKAVIKGAEEYMLQYRENGTVTVAVEYNNGYVKVFHCEINMKQASCTLSGRTVLLRKLDDFVMIRYAPGEYSTSAEIKRASGSKVIKPADLTGEYAIVSDLAKGTYTFCVQFDDESYNYFKIVIE